MAEFVFTSPGYKFKERDLTFVTRNVGITTLGLVGETLKGPAFEPVFVQDKTQFAERFGLQSLKRFSDGNLQYQLPYVANSYLEESNQLWVTRVLGLSGYDAGTAWALTISAGADPTTESLSGATVNTGVAFTDNMYLGVALANVGATGEYSSGYTKLQDGSFKEVRHSFTATTKNGTSGTVRDKVSVYTATAHAEYENMVVAIIRSRGYVVDSLDAAATTIFDTTSLTMSGNTTVIGSGDLFGTFVLTATSTASTATYTVSLNPNASNFLPKVIGAEPKDKKTKIWVQAIYPELIKKLDAEGLGYGVNTTMLECDSTNYTDYKTKFQTPETPWIVSQLKGNSVDRLFKFISISDGDNANQEIKISIANINPMTLEFDVVVRDFYDTDANPKVLETFSKCSMIKGLNSYIARRIGTTDGEYTLMSKYIMIELAENISDGVFPAGFEGYNFNNFATGATGAATSGRTPSIFYKKSYELTDRVTKTYLGISERGYDTTSGVGTGINQNFFNFKGKGGFTNSKGFHMDSGATGTYNGFQFEVGAGDFQTVSDVIDGANPYFDIKSRKFTLVPAGGFDGWNVHRTSRSYGDNFRLNGIFDGVPANGNPTNDFQAWETAIDTFANPEDVTINVFATPGINWSDQNILVRNTIEMMEEQRTDSFYVIDCPDVKVEVSVGDGGKADIIAAQDVVDLLETADLDTSYAGTYYPWIQMPDSQNNVNVYLPPTGEVVKAIAFTDNTKAPWYAPAGVNRGVTNAKKSKYKLSQEARDILYKGRINPMLDFAEVGTAIFGQKTLQKKETALDRINVRRLLLQAKVLIANIAIRLVFEQDDQATIDQFLGKVNPILASIKRERGLLDFRVKMDNTLNTPEAFDRNELYGQIYLKPTRSLEYIGIEFVVTPSGASFSDVGA